MLHDPRLHRLLLLLQLFSLLLDELCKVSWHLELHKVFTKRGDARFGKCVVPLVLEKVINLVQPFMVEVLKRYLRQFTLLLQVYGLLEFLLSVF